MSYREKYLKYKSKYLDLKRQLGGACPASNPDDPSALINMNNDAGKKELLRQYLKDVGRPNDGEFGPVKQGVKKPEEHSSWNAAKAYYENGCVFGPPCKQQADKKQCTDGANTKIMSDKGFLCRWNMTANVCEERPKDKISFQ